MKLSRLRQIVVGKGKERKEKERKSIYIAPFILGLRIVSKGPDMDHTFYLQIAPYLPGELQYRSTISSLTMALATMATVMESM